MDPVSALMIASSIITLVDSTNIFANRLRRSIRGARTSDVGYAQLTADLQSAELDLKKIIETRDLGDIDDETRRAISAITRDYGSKIEALKIIFETPSAPPRGFRRNPAAKIEKAVSELRPTLKEISRLANLLERLQIQKVEDRSAIHAWLSTTDPVPHYQNALKQRQPKTGEWFLGSDEYLQWRDGQTQFLWIQGPPGSGKTILSAIAVENVLQLSGESRRHGVGYFYFRYQDLQNNEAVLMVRSLVSQLLSQSTWPSDHLDELFRTCENGMMQPSLESLLVVLRQMIEGFGQTHFIVDALDECSTRDTLLHVLSNMNAWNLKNLHILLTSRAELDIQRFLEPIVDEANVVHVEGQAVNMEIRNYIRSRLSEMEGNLKFKGSEKQIEKVLLQKSDGMFLLAQSQLDLLAQCPDRSAVQKMLLQLPNSLNELYTQILSNIRGDQADVAVRILQWLTYGKRPLTVQELADAAAIIPLQTSTSQQPVLSKDPLDLLGVLPSLITVRKDDANSSRHKRIVTFSHISVKEFLTSEICRTSSAAKFYMQSEACNSSIGDSCLDYLFRFDSFDAPVLERMKHAKLARYAAQYWTDHIRDGPKNDESSRSRIARLFSSSNPAFYNWVRIYDHDNPQSDIDFTRAADTILSPLYYACLLGLSEVVRSLVNSTDDIPAKRVGTFQSILQAAAAGGREQVVEILLQNGVNADEHGGYFESALQVASAAGYERIVNLLIGHGANVNAHAGFYGNALQAASFMGRENIARLLLDRGADINAQGGEYCNALQAASIKGHERIVKVLLDFGADANAQGGSHFTSLKAATFGGHTSTIQLLLDAGADVNSQTDSNETAVEVASLRGYTSIVQLLLSAGADVRKGSRKHGNPLSAAAFEGNFDAAKLLIDVGASANEAGGEYGNALQAASCNDHKALVTLLLDSGADVNTLGGFFGSALYAGAARGHLRIVDTLLQAGAEIDATFEDGGTALYAASLAGHEQVVAVLLEAGADVTARGGQYGYALQAAAHGGHQSVVAKLLGANTDVNALGGEYGTALEAACHGGHAKVADRLINVGAEINARAGFYGTALQAAAFSGERDLVQQLIESGALVNATGGHYGHALEAASHQGHYEVVQILLAAGADVDLRGGEYDCALVAAFWENNDSVVDLLLQAGASANREGGSKDDINIAGQITTDLTQWIEDAPKSGLVAPTMVTLRFETETPAAMSFKQQLPDDENPDQWLSNTVMMVRKHISNADGETVTAVEALTSREYVMRQWGALGEQILKDISAALALDAGAQMANSYVAIDESVVEYSIAFSDTYLLVHIENTTFDSNLTSFIEAIDAICRAIRIPQNPSTEGITWLSSASYRAYKFDAKSSTSLERKTAHSGVFLSSLLSEELVDEFNDQCWQPFFESCYIMDEIRPCISEKAFGKGLEMSFDLMTVLAGTEYFVPFEGGVLLVGYQTVLYPTSLEKDYAQFHLIVDKKKQINPFQQSYGQRVLIEDHTMFRNLPCFVGWCDVAQIYLGTKEMLKTVDYSKAKEKGKSLVLTGISVGAQAASVAPAQVGGNIAANYKLVSYNIAYAPSFNFSRMLRDTAQETVLIFDFVTRRSWLVPKLSLILHMAHIWYLRQERPVDISADPIPFATPHENAKSLVIQLDDKGNTTICGHGEDEYKLRTVMVGLNLNLFTTLRNIKQSKSGELFGFEFMDIVTEPARGGVMRSVKVKSGHAWLELANSADAVVICANLGEAMHPKPDIARRRNAKCNLLPSKEDYLAAHMSCLIRIASRAGVSSIPQGSGADAANQLVTDQLLSEHGAQLHNDHSLNITGNPFAVCTHFANDRSSCWTKRDMIQCLLYKGLLSILHIGVERRLPPPQALNHNGAVVFGPQAEQSGSM